MNNQHVAVVGLGLLGRGITANLLSHGFRVTGYDRSAASLTKAKEVIAQAIDELIEHEECRPALRSEWRAQYTGTSAIGDLASTTFVIECVIENVAAKSVVFDEIERVVADDVPVASNTSAIPISEMQRARQHPERFLGMHWAEPAYVTRFLELIRGAQTGDAAFERAIELAHQCGKDPSHVNIDVPGFIANRLGYAMYREALHLLAAGVADAETIDRAFRNSIGLWSAFCGPLRWIDLTGGPALYAKAMEPVLPALDAGHAVPSLLAELAQQNARGIVNGRGFYQYTPAEAERWERLLRHHAWEIKRLIDRERPLESPP